MPPQINIYDSRYLEEGYRSILSGYEFARWKALEHFISKVLTLTDIRKVLDYGCGNGLYVKLWEKIFPRVELSFADISSAALAQLAEKHPEYKSTSELILNNKTRFKDETFDVVVSVEVMEHVVDLDAYLKDIQRVLKPGGYFIWTTPCANRLSFEHIYSCLKGYIELTDEGYKRWKWEEPSHLRRLRTQEIKKKLLTIGFQKVGVRFRAHLFSFICTKLYERNMMSERLSNKLMEYDYTLFRNLPNGASMIGYAKNGS